MHSSDRNEEPAVPPAPNYRAAVAALRVDVALVALEDAQRLAELATQALCAVDGMAREHERLAELYEDVRRSFYVVKDRATRLQRNSRLLLDHEPDEREVSRWCSLRERRRL